MKTVWKFPLGIKDEQTISMPEGSKILSIQSQNNFPCIWALVDTDGKLEKRHFAIFGTYNLIETGHLTETGQQLEFIGTVQIMAGQHVLHVFENKAAGQ